MDWHIWVRSQLPDITGDAARDRDIVDEIAQDLAERYEELCAAGVSDADALAQVTAELTGAVSWPARLPTLTGHVRASLFHRP
jgi:hypothetical protein